jgi:hypothetical protein
MLTKDQLPVGSIRGPQRIADAATEHGKGECVPGWCVIIPPTARFAEQQPVHGIRSPRREATNAEYPKIPSVMQNRLASAGSCALRARSVQAGGQQPQRVLCKT